MAQAVEHQCVRIRQRRVQVMQVSGDRVSPVGLFPRMDKVRLQIGGVWLRILRNSNSCDLLCYSKRHGGKPVWVRRGISEGDWVPTAEGLVELSEYTPDGRPLARSVNGEKVREWGLFSEVPKCTRSLFELLVHLGADLKDAARCSRRFEELTPYAPIESVCRAVRELSDAGRNPHQICLKLAECESLAEVQGLLGLRAEDVKDYRVHEDEVPRGVIEMLASAVFDLVPA